MGMMPNPDVALDEKAIVVEAEKALGDIATIRQEVAKVIFGQEKVVENTLLAILSGGHALLVGVPGLAKTLLGWTAQRDVSEMCRDGWRWQASQQQD